MARRLTFAIVAVVLAALAGPVDAQPLLADLFKHRITIDSGFTGADVLLYGAIDGEGDVVIVVRGPEERVVVRRKDRVAGIWINVDDVEFTGVPAYYAVATSRPLADIVRASFRGLYQIGLPSLRLDTADARPAEEIATFREALIRNRVRDGLFAGEIGKIEFPGETLFRTLVHFPANVTEGTYSAQIFLIRDGVEVSSETIPLFVNKTGFQAEVNYWAHAQPAIYGLVAILLALVSGWVAAVAFRKG
jgi:uncharacterized protein (TIGR02186 family)